MEYHIYTYVYAIDGGMRVSMAAVMAMYAHIYGP